MDLIIFQQINQLVFKWLWLDTFAIFFAKYFGYIVVLLLFSFLFWPSKTKKAERGRGNWVFPRVGKQAFPDEIGKNIRNREVSKERSDFLLKNFKKYWQMLILALLSGIFARFIIVGIIRWLLERPRPFIDNHVNLLVDHVNQSAFPSGHAAFFFAVATIVYFYNKKAGLLFFGASFLISIARVFAGIHWPSDILAGALVGIFSAALILLSFRKFSSVAK